MAVCVWQLDLQPPVIVRNVGIALAGLVLPALAAFLYAAWSNPAKRRTIGVLWDVGTFWPRSYHPLCPPCYAERAVPDLQRRMWWLHDNDGRVMLVAHSQGTVLAVAALAQTACRPEGDHPALITFGSPVCKLYGWAFPAYFDRALLAPLAPGQAARVNDWRNFFYPTDPIGGSVAPELSAVGGDPVDTEFPDPARLLLRVRPAAARVHGPLRLLGGPPGLGRDQRRRGRASRRAGRHLPRTGPGDRARSGGPLGRTVRGVSGRLRVRKGEGRRDPHAARAWARSLR